jgi:hypothetical protein
MKFGTLVPGALVLGAMSIVAACNLSNRVDPAGSGGTGGNSPTAGSGGGSGGGGNGGGADAAAGRGPGLPPPGWDGSVAAPTFECMGLECRQSTCTRGNCMVPRCQGTARTTVSGTVYDPAGKVPLYNITVYVPNAPLDPITDGPSCDPCDPKTGTSLVSGKPIVLSKTDPAGKFTLGAGDGGDVPAGTDIPLVIQVGKWRRQVTLPMVAPCTDNQLMDPELTRLPRKQSEGHIPKMALTTGSADALECLLRKVGIDDSEFTPEAGTGRVNFFAGGGGTSAYDATLNGGAAFTPVRPWWDDVENLKKYDIILHSCEGNQGSFTGAASPTSTKSMEARQALQTFADLGGRVFASHWHVYWFEQGPPAFRSIATFNHRSGLPNPYNATIDPDRRELIQWMVNVGGSPMPGRVLLRQDANQTTVDVVAGGSVSQRWIYAADRTPQAVQYLSANTPVMPASPMPPMNQCGKVVLSDIHVSAGGGAAAMSDLPNRPFPTGCVTTELSPQEKVLEFMLFDIASCVAPIIP